MIGLDTNVLVRYIVRDDDEQAEAATRLIESKCTADNPGLVSSIVMCELAWVLTRATVIAATWSVASYGGSCPFKSCKWKMPKWRGRLSDSLSRGRLISQIT